MTASHVPQRLQGGQAVLNYRVLRELGSRAAPVYAAHRMVGGRPELAVLQHFRLPREASSALTGVLRDARAVAEVSHPHLMRVRGAEPVGEEIVVVSDFIEGESLAGLLSLAAAHGTTVSVEVTLSILVDVLAGTQALHDTRDARRRSIGLYHGLLSPAEIVVGLDGLSRVIGAFHTLPLRVPTQAPDATIYFAPEVLAAEQGVEKRADIYGAGMLLWAALGGELAVRPSRGAVERPKLAPELAWAEPLIDVSLRALMTDPKERYESAEEMLAAVRLHAKLSSQVTIATLVRQLAGERILRRRGEFAVASAREQAAHDDESVTASMPQPPPDAERRDDTVTVTTTVNGEPQKPAKREPPGDDSITGEAPAPVPSSDATDDSITAISPPAAAPTPPPSSAARQTGTPPVLAPAPAPAASAARSATDHPDDEALNTEIRAALPSHADAIDDSVTATAPVSPALLAESARSTTEGSVSVLFEQEPPRAEVRTVAEEEEVVTRVEPVGHVLSALGRATSPSATSFPPLSALPGPSSLPGETVVTVEPNHAVNAPGSMFHSVADPNANMTHSALPDPFAAPPSYKRLGILLGLLLVGAGALLVFVILRAAAENVVAVTAPDGRTKAARVVQSDKVEEMLSSKKGVVAPAKSGKLPLKPPAKPKER